MRDLLGSGLAALVFWLLAPALSLAEPPKLLLEGVIVADNPALSIALLRSPDAERARALRIGQQYRGYVLREVTRSSVVLDGRDGALRLSLGAEVAANEGGPRRAEVEANPADEGGWIHHHFSRARTKARFEKEIPAILSDTELVPSVEDGEIRGIELHRLPDGTLLSESGLFPGDVLKSINGEPIRGLDALWDALARLREASEIRLVVERRGEVVRLTYDFTN